MNTNSIRPIWIVGDVAYVPLTRGYTATIDAADVPLVEAWNWCARLERNAVYAARGAWVNGKKRTIYMHRELVGQVGGCEVDHRDGDGLNNRRANLRHATAAQNQRNQRIRPNNTSGLKGASYHKATGKWSAQIRANGKPVYLGLFETPEAAHAAYAKASAELHGEFGRLA